MKTNNLENYIGSLLNTLEVDRKIMGEISNSKLILTAYRLGLEKKEFPVYFLLKELSLEKDIPEPWHIAVAQIAIIKSKTSEPMLRDYLLKNVEELLKEFRDYFTSKEV